MRVKTRPSGSGRIVPPSSRASDVFGRCSLGYHSFVTRDRFDQLVLEALEGIPPAFRERLENVEILVEDEPSASLLREMGMDSKCDTLFGLYQGVPLSERGSDRLVLLPDCITLFYRPLVRCFRTPGAIRREIQRTLVHEVAHFFGMDDDQIEEEGY